MSKQYKSLLDFQKDYHFDFSDPKTHLGEGNYGEVVKAFDKNNNTWIALKRSKSSNTDLQKEFDAAKDLNHPNIAKYQSCYRLSDPNVGVREYAIIKLYECNLNHLVQNENIKLSNYQTHELVKSILLGLEYLHNNKRIHRDFKPGNILISTLSDGNYTAHITDFGLTKIVSKDDLIDGSDIMLSDGRGTASYKAPEQIVGEKAYYNMDLWAFWVILFEILTGEKPFKRGTIGTEVQKDNELFRQIKNVTIPNRINQIAEPYQCIIRRCLVKDIHKRVRKESELLDLLDEIPKLLQQAQQFYKNGKYTLAIKRYEDILHLRPNNQDAKIGLADSRKKQSLLEEPKTDEAKSAKKVEQNGNEELTDDAKLKKIKFDWGQYLTYLLLVLPFIAGFLHVLFTNLYYTKQPDLPYFEFSFNKITGLNLALLFEIFTIGVYGLSLINKSFEDLLDNILIFIFLAFLSGAITWIVRFTFLEPYEKNIIQPTITGFVTDEKDGQKYPLSTIGKKVWMMKDMNYMTKAYSSYEEFNSWRGVDKSNVYRKYTYADAKSICPKGFHLPSNDEWIGFARNISPTIWFKKHVIDNFEFDTFLDIFPVSQNGFLSKNSQKIQTMHGINYWTSDSLSLVHISNYDSTSAINFQKNLEQNVSNDRKACRCIKD